MYRWIVARNSEEARAAAEAKYPGKVKELVQVTLESLCYMHSIAPALNALLSSTGHLHHQFDRLLVVKTWTCQ